MNDEILETGHKILIGSGASRYKIAETYDNLKKAGKIPDKHMISGEKADA